MIHHQAAVSPKSPEGNFPLSLNPSCFSSQNLPKYRNTAEGEGTPLLRSFLHLRSISRRSLRFNPCFPTFSSIRQNPSSPSSRFRSSTHSPPARFNSIKDITTSLSLHP